VRLARRFAISVAAVALLYVGLLAVFHIWARHPGTHARCPVEGALVQVDTAARVLSLCRDGHEDASFRVALGSGGVDKRAEGDSRTPRGRYALGPARASEGFYLFLEVGYPTGEQMKHGFTGSAIGVHGPPRGFAWLGHATVWPDWTLGCIALGTRAEVERVARWVRENSVGEIVLL